MRRQTAILMAFFALSSACSARIQQGLEERQANEIISALSERGIEATKELEGGKKPTWAIEVSRGDSTDAVRLLTELGLPRVRVDGFGDVFGKGSLVPTATEERALYLQALSGELSRTLESMEGVTSARVHLVLPPPPRPGQPTVESKASAFLRVRPGARARLQNRDEELKALIAGSADGLRIDNVTILLDEIVPAPIKTDTRSPAEARLRAVAFVLFGLVLVLAALVVFLVLRLRAFRASAPSNPDAGALQLGIGQPAKAA